MLKISKLADYATVIMHYLATHLDERFSANAISEQLGIAAPTVSKVLKLLNIAGLVTAMRGVQGGYHLSRPPNQVSLAEIISAIDGQPAITECSDNHGCCQYGDHCGVRDNWQYINTLIYKILDGLNLNDMLSSLAKSNVMPIHFFDLKKQENKHARNREHY